MSDLIVTPKNLYVPKNERMPMNELITPQMLSRMDGRRYDAQETAFFLRQLTYVIEQTYDIEYPDLKARSLFPVDSRPGPGADSFIWRQFDKEGQAIIVQNYADDFPNVELTGKEFQTRIYSLGNSYQYTLQDMRAAAMANLALDSRKAEIARYTMLQTMEQFAATGPSPTEATDATPQYGFCNNPNIQTKMAASVWTSASTTVSQILADVNAAQNAIFTSTLGKHTGNTLLLNTAAYAQLSTTARSVTFTDDSILQYILKQSPWLKSIEYWPWLDKAGKLQDNSTVGPACMLYDRSPEVVQMVIPQDFEVLPPQQIGMSFKFPCHARWGGITVHYPLAVCKINGTTG
jgi:hypothetical protein